MDISSNPDPIGALAAHFRSLGSESVERHATLRVPLFLREGLDEKLNPQKELTAGARVPLTAKEVKDLVNSIGKEEFERWCLLDARAFTFVTRVLLGAPPCLEKDQGLFRLIVSSLLLEALETLKDENSELSMPKNLLADYKDIIGEFLVVELLGYFIGTEGSELSRRWAGLLLVELLEGSEVNRDRIWKMPDKTFKGIGEIIVSGTERMLKTVAGKIIWQMMQGFESEEEIRYRLPAFCQSGGTGVSDFTKDFPLQNGSQWENKFANFVTDMEENRYDLDIGLPTGYNGYQVKIGNNNPINAAFGMISISIAEIFSIYIPPNRDRSPDWVDLKIINISKVEPASQEVAGDRVKDFTYLKLHLCDYEKDGYLYLLSMRPSSDSDNVMILCDKTDAEDFVEDVQRCRAKVLNRRSNRLQMSSAPVKDIQVNSARHQSQQVKLDELERHRDNILKVLESPEESPNSTPVTGSSEVGDGFGLAVTEERGLNKLGKAPSADFVEMGETNGPGPRDLNKDFEPTSMAFRQQKPIIYPVKSGPSRDFVEMPSIASKEIEESLGSSPPILHPIKDLPDDTFEIPLKNSSRYLRSLIHPQQAKENLKDSIHSDSELSDVTDVPDEYQLELLFENMPAKGNTTERLAKSRYKLQGKPEAANSKVARRLEFAANESAVAVELKAGSGKTSGHQPQHNIPRALEASPRVVRLVEAKQVPEKKLRPEIRKPSGFLDDMLDVEGSVGSNASLRRNNQPKFPRAEGPFYILTKKKEDIPKTISQSIVSETVGSLHDTSVMEDHVVLKDDPKRKSRPAVRNLAGLLDDVLTPPGTYEAKQIAQKRGGLKERLIGKNDGSGKKQDHAQTSTTKSNTVLKSHATTANLEKPELALLEDTSIWDLPESGNSEKEKSPPKKGKGKDNTEPKKQMRAAKPPKVKQLSKQRLVPKKRVYEKKSGVNQKSGLNELILDSDEDIGSTEEVLPVQVPIHKIKRKSIPGPTTAKRIVVQNMEDEGVVSTKGDGFLAHTSEQKNVRKVAFALVPGTATQEINSLEENTLPAPQLNKPGPNSKAVSASVPAKHTVTMENEDGGIGSWEERNLHAPIPKRNIALKVVPTSAPVKRAASQEIVSEGDNSKDLGPLVKRKKLEQANSVRVKATLWHPRPRASKVPATSKKHPKVDIFQNTSEADEDSPWRPKTRLQAKMELAAKSRNQKKVMKVGHRKVKEAAEVSQGPESSGISSDGPNYKTSSVLRTEKAQEASGIAGAPYVEIDSLRSVGQSQSLSSEISVETQTETKKQGVKGKQTGVVTKTKSYAPKKPAPEPNTTSNYINSGYDTTTALGNSTDSNKELRPMDLTDPISLLQKDRGLNKSLGYKRRVISDEDPGTSANSPENSDTIGRTALDQPGARLQLGTHRRALDGPMIDDQDIKEHLIQSMPLTAEKRLAGDPTPVTAESFEGLSPSLTSFNASHLLGDSSRASTPFGEESLELLLPQVTPRRLDKTPKTPLANPYTLIDDRLARKTQIISWNSEGAKNQGQTPVADQNLVRSKGLSRQTEYLADDETLLPKSEYALSLYVLAGDDEDQVVRRKKWGSSPFISRPARKNTGAIVNKDGSPLLTVENRRQIYSVKSPKIDSGQENSEDEEEIDALAVDITEDMVQPNQKSSAVSGQRIKPLTVTKKSPELKQMSYINLRDASDTDADLRMDDLPKYDNQVSFAADSLERTAGNHEDEEPFTTEERTQQARHKDLASRTISIIEIIESDLEEIEAGREKAIMFSAVENRGLEPFPPPNKKVPAEKAQLASKPSLPVPKEGLLAFGKDSVLVRNRFLASQSSPPTTSKTQPALDDDTFADFAEESSHRKSDFFKWVHKIGSMRPNNSISNDRTAPERFSANLQQEDPDKTLVNLGDFSNGGVDQNFDGNSEEAPARGQEQRRKLLGTDSDDSSNSSIVDDGDSSDSNEDEEDIEISEDENSQLVWRKSLPDHHRETLAILDQISQGLLRYLMSGEELALEIIKDFEKQGSEIVRQLGESHKKEYGEFLDKVRAGKQKVQREHTRILKTVERDSLKLEKEKATLTNLRTKINYNYSTLDSKISKLMVDLEKGLEGAVEP